MKSLLGATMVVLASGCIPTGDTDGPRWAPTEKETVMLCSWDCELSLVRSDSLVSYTIADRRELRGGICDDLSKNLYIRDHHSGFPCYVPLDVYCGKGLESFYIAGPACAAR